MPVPQKLLNEGERVVVSTRGVGSRSGVVDRMFGCGTLVVSDASELGRVALPDVPRVEGVRRRVVEELHHQGRPDDDPRARTNDDGT